MRLQPIERGLGGWMDECVSSNDLNLANFRERAEATLQSVPVRRPPRLIRETSHLSEVAVLDEIRMDNCTGSLRVSTPVSVQGSSGELLRHWSEVKVQRQGSQLEPIRGDARLAPIGTNEKGLHRSGIVGDQAGTMKRGKRKRRRRRRIQPLDTVEDNNHKQSQISPSCSVVKSEGMAKESREWKSIGLSDSTSLKVVSDPSDTDRAGRKCVAGPCKPKMLWLFVSVVTIFSVLAALLHFFLVSDSVKKLNPRGSSSPFDVILADLTVYDLVISQEPLFFNITVSHTAAFINTSNSSVTAVFKNQRSLSRLILSAHPRWVRINVTLFFAVDGAVDETRGSANSISLSHPGVFSVMENTTYFVRSLVQVLKHHGLSCKVRLGWPDPGNVDEIDALDSNSVPLVSDSSNAMTTIPTATAEASLGVPSISTTQQVETSTVPELVTSSPSTNSGDELSGNGTVGATERVMGVTIEPNATRASRQANDVNTTLFVSTAPSELSGPSYPLLQNGSAANIFENSSLLVESDADISLTLGINATNSIAACNTSVIPCSSLVQISSSAGSNISETAGPPRLINCLNCSANVSTYVVESEPTHDILNISDSVQSRAENRLTSVNSTYTESSRSFVNYLNNWTASDQVICSLDATQTSSPVLFNTDGSVASFNWWKGSVTFAWDENTSLPVWLWAKTYCLSVNHNSWFIKDGDTQKVWHMPVSSTFVWTRFEDPVYSTEIQLLGREIYCSISAVYLGNATPGVDVTMPRCALPDSNTVSLAAPGSEKFCNVSVLECGDGCLSEMETCDSGNGLGCGNCSFVAEGFQCESSHSGSYCFPLCGDGRRLGSAGCQCDVVDIVPYLPPSAFTASSCWNDKEHGAEIDDPVSLGYRCLSDSHGLVPRGRGAPSCIVDPQNCTFQGWSAGVPLNLSDSYEPFLVVDLGSTVPVKGVSLKRPSSGALQEMVLSARVSTSRDSFSWSKPVDISSSFTFGVYADPNRAKHRELFNEIILARWVRFEAITCLNWCSLAVEVLACNSSTYQNCPEGCDDGNTVNDDGCSTICTVEEGFDCGDGTDCAPICGDGHLAGFEGCDDGNSIGGDGCSSNCSVESGFHCKDPSETPASETCSPVCGDGVVVGYGGANTVYRNESDRCYWYFSGAKDWLAASEVCQRDAGASLTTVVDSNENDFLANFAGGRSFWIGLNDRRIEGTFEWVDGSTFLFRAWNPWNTNPAVGPEPNNYGGSENCAASNTFYGIPEGQSGLGVWNDANCGTAKVFVCSRPGRCGELCDPAMGPNCSSSCKPTVA